MIIGANQRDELSQQWLLIEQGFKETFGKKPDLNGMLFIIGIQELGQGYREFSKEEKQDLMHIATCKVLSYAGYYALEGLDAQGWPHWQNIKPVPVQNLEEQEMLLKLGIIEFCQKELTWEV